MTDLIQKALIATRESKHVEFKQGFDPSTSGEWCELVKDIAAIANSGGGIIVFGLDSAGIPAGVSVDYIRAIDPADIGNKLAKYTGPVDLEFEFRALEKGGSPLVALLIQPVAIPLIWLLTVKQEEITPATFLRGYASSYIPEHMPDQNLG